MKRRNLFLSLICSILMAVALVTFTVISVVPKKENNNNINAGQVSDKTDTDPDENLTINDENDGSVEKPYIIYSADSFMSYLVGKYTDENGKYIDYTETDDTGALVYPELNAGLNYVLKNDIDFAGSNFVTIFNEGIAFNGNIDGAGFALKNISINVTKENIDSYAKLLSDGKFSANVAVFGKLDNAEIKNVAIEDVNIVIDDEVYSYVTSGDFATDKGSAMKQISVGSLASLAYNTKINSVAVSGTVNAGAYSVYAANYVQGFNALGGVVAVADTCELSNINTDLEMNVSNGKKFFVGGVAGYAYETTLNIADVKSDILANYEQGLYVGGAFGYALAVNLDEVNVTLSVNETTLDRFNTKGVTAVNDVNFIWVAGLINRLEAKTSSDVTTIANSKVLANVDIDGMYAGAVMDVFTDAKTTILNVKDVILDSNVNTLKAYGFARTLVYAKVELSASEVDEANEIEFNIRLTGNLRLTPIANGTDKLIVATMFSNIGTKSNVEVVNGILSIKPVCSLSVYARLEKLDQMRIWGNTENGTKAWAF